MNENISLLNSNTIFKSFEIIRKCRYSNDLIKNYNHFFPRKNKRNKMLERIYHTTVRPNVIIYNVTRMQTDHNILLCKYNFISNE